MRTPNEWADIFRERLDQLMPVCCAEDGVFPIEEAIQVAETLFAECQTEVLNRHTPTPNKLPNP